MGPVAIDRRASSSLADLIATMSEEELCVEAAPDAAPLCSADLAPPLVFLSPPAGNLTADSPPTPEASVYGFSRGPGAGGKRCAALHMRVYNAGECAHAYSR